MAADDETPSPFKAVNEVRAARKAGEPMNIVICFDGTGGEPAWAVQAEDERGEVPRFANGGGLSNICKVHLLAGGVVDNSSCHNNGQVSLYYKGVGTWTDGFTQVMRAAFGVGAMEEIYRKAYADLRRIHREGDKIYLFGFSRGAATARLFASFLDKERNAIGGIKPAVAFLGAFDTVVQSSAVGASEDVKILDVDGADSRLPSCVARAVHLVSLDDRREPFRPTLFNADDRVTEVWCPGNHSDVGGGYYHDGMSDACLRCMLKEAELAGMRLRALGRDTPKAAIVGEGALRNFAEFDKDMRVRPDGLDPDVHDECAYLPYGLLNLSKWFSHRHVRRLRDDAVDGAAPVLVLDTALARYERYAEVVPYFFQHPPYVRSGWSLLPSAATSYRPQNLVGVPHKIVTVGEKGIVVAARWEGSDSPIYDSPIWVSSHHSLLKTIFLGLLIAFLWPLLFGDTS